MPLAPLPPSNTQRYFIGLNGGGHQHHIQVRTTDSVDPAQAVIDLGFVATTLQPIVYSNYSFNELLHAAKNSDIRNPVPGWEVIDGTQAFGQPEVDHPYALCARGRSTTGRKARLFLWGCNAPRTGQWTFIPDAGSALEAFIQILITTPSYFLAIDGTKPVWRLDFTAGYHDAIVEDDRPAG